MFARYGLVGNEKITKIKTARKTKQNETTNIHDKARSDGRCVGGLVKES